MTKNRNEKRARRLEAERRGIPYSKVDSVPPSELAIEVINALFDDEEAKARLSDWDKATLAGDFFTILLGWMDDAKSIVESGNDFLPHFFSGGEVSFVLVERDVKNTYLIEPIIRLDKGAKPEDVEEVESYVRESSSTFSAFYLDMRDESNPVLSYLLPQK